MLEKAPWLGLRNSRLSSWGAFTAGLFLSVLVCYWMIDLASGGGLGAAVAFVLGLYAVVAALVVALVVSTSLPGWRKKVALLTATGILLPAALFVSIQIGYTRSPDAATQRNGQKIVQALQAYQTDIGHYPTTLDPLVPAYLEALPQKPSATWTWFYCGSLDDFPAEYVGPDATQGWLYCATQDGFALGYVYWIDKRGYSVHAYTSETWTWESFHPDLSASTGPFTIGPTQAPADSSKPPLPRPTRTPLFP